MEINSEVKGMKKDKLDNEEITVTSFYSCRII